MNYTEMDAFSQPPSSVEEAGATPHFKNCPAGLVEFIVIIGFSQHQGSLYTKVGSAGSRDEIA